MGEESSEGTITRLHKELSDGDRSAYDRLMPVVLDELKMIAHARFRDEPSGHTLQATALVNEAYLRIAGLRSIEWRDRKHFFHAAAGVIRRILVDHARKKRAQKRPDPRKRVPLNPSIPDPQDIDVLALNEALERLAELDQRQCQIVEMKYFGGMTVSDIADVLEVSKRTVEADWTMARAWLRRELSREDP